MPRIDSENSVNFASPYSGAQKGTLTLALHPLSGQNALISIRRGQLMCGVSGCRVRVKFDDAAPLHWQAKPQGDGSSDSLILQSGAQFAQRVRASTVVLIEVPVFREPNALFEFQVGGFNNARATGR